MNPNSLHKNLINLNNIKIIPLSSYGIIESTHEVRRCRTKVSIVALLLTFFFGNYVMIAQSPNSEGNITRLSAGTGVGAAAGNSLQRDLLPLVMSASNGGGVGLGQQPYQVGVISVRPSYIQLLAQQMAPNYRRPSDMVGGNFSSSKAFPYGPTALAQPLTVDPDDMEIGSLTWFTFRGINFNNPNVQFGLEYDTNSSNVAGQNSDPAIAQLSTIRIPFTYGTVPGDSAFLMQLDYKPTYRLLLSGPGGNEINHDVNFRAGKDLGRFAYSFINQAVLSSFPIRELPGRNRVFSNRTSLRAAYEVAPKSFILSEIGHSITTRTRTVTPILSGESRTASIVLDDFQFLYNYQLKPKLPIIPDFTLSRTQLADTIIWTKSMGLNAAYFPTTRLVLTPRAGIQFRDTKGSPTQVSNFYGIGMDYMMRPKTVLGLDLVSDVRPSFVDEGIFLREDSIELGIQEALLLRWLLELRLNYTLRTQDSSAAIAGIDQTDIEVEFTVNYILTQMSFIDFGINRYQIKDNNTGLRGKRLNIQLSYNRAF